MGEVYRARDTRLNREVALKTLPPEFAADLGRRQRFEQEARAVAALNHPNIVGIFDTGTDGATSYIISELVTGDTLRALMSRGPVPVRKLLDVAAQIADGLAAAHAAKIVHRDLKPENIMLTPEGRVKILDFGLARQSTIPASTGDRTVTVYHSEPGMVVGTVNYMSPEQASGKPVDHRSDQFSFGLILYEMAAGKKAFEKRESVLTLSAILTEDPPPIEAKIPPPLRWIIDRCLAKEPEGRYESTRDLYQELRNVRDHLSETSTTQMPPVTPGRLRVRSWWPWAGIALALIGGLAVGALFISSSGPSLASYRFTPFAVDPEGQGSAVWSPDGKAVAYRGTVDGQSQVLIRYLDSPTPVQITKIPEGAVPIAWSPDGARIFFMSSRQPAGIWSVAAVGGEPESVMPLDGRTRDIRRDNQALVVFRAGPDGVSSLWVSAPIGSPLTPYSPAPFATKDVYNAPQVRFSPDGSKVLLYLRGDRTRDQAWLMPYPADARRPPRVILQNLPTSGGTPTFSWMPDNRRIAVSFQASQDAPTHLWIADTDSNDMRPLTIGGSDELGPAVSPDGRKIVYVEGRADFDVMSVSFDKPEARRFVGTDRDELTPAWAANVPRLAYVTNRNGAIEIWVHNGDGSDRPIVSARDFPPGTTQWFMTPSPSPDGNRVVYVRVEQVGNSWLWISSLSGGSPVRLTVREKGTEFGGSWSPDGNSFVFLAVQEGAFSLMKVKTTGQATPVLLKSGVDGALPSWSPNGDWITFHKGDRWSLISRDGKTERSLGQAQTENLAFSKDGKRLYGIRDEPRREVLFWLDVTTGTKTDLGDIGKDSPPRSSLNPGIRFSLAPDGKSFVYPSARIRANLWMLEGFNEQPSLLERLGLRHTR